jgi:hypothetical protein
VVSAAIYSLGKRREDAFVVPDVKGCEMNRRRFFQSVAAFGVGVSDVQIAAADGEVITINLFVTDSIAELNAEECMFAEPQQLLAVPSDGGDPISYDISDSGEPATIQRSGVTTPGCLFQLDITLPRATHFDFAIGDTSLGSMNYVLLARRGSMTLVWEQPYGDSVADSSADLGSVVTVGKWDVSVDLAAIDDAPRGSIHDYRLLVTLDVTQLESGTHFVSQNVKLAVVTDTGSVITEDRNASDKAQQVLGQTLGGHGVGDQREYMFVFNIPRDWEIPWKKETIEGWKLHIEFRGDSASLPLSIMLPD